MPHALKNYYEPKNNLKFVFGAEETMDILCSSQHRGDKEPLIAGFKFFSEITNDSLVNASSSESQTSDNILPARVHQWAQKVIWHYNDKSNSLIIIPPVDNIGWQPAPNSYYELVAERLKEQLHLSNCHVFNLSLRLNFFNEPRMLFICDEEMYKIAGSHQCPFDARYGVTVLVRAAQYLRDLDTPDTLEDMADKCWKLVRSSITAKRMEPVHSTTQMREILQETVPDTINDKPMTPETKHFFRELMCLKKLYKERVEIKQTYLGPYGLFGHFTAQQKLNALSKFLTNEVEPLDKAAKQGELGKLITAYQQSQQESSATPTVSV